MKKFVILCLSLPLLWQCTPGPSRSELLIERDSLVMATAQKEIQMNELVGTLADIEENLRLIKEKEQIISLQAETGDVRGARGEQINQDIQVLHELMVQNRDRVQELERKMRNAGVENQRLNRLITGLNEQIRVQAEEIAFLQEQVAQRDAQIGQLNRDLQDMGHEMDAIRTAAEATRQQLDATTDQYNAAWYVIGTRRDLRAQNILTRDGFLFFGSTNLMKEDFNNQYLNRIDIRNTNRIALNSRRAELLTTHPAGSFELINGGDGNLVLVINDSARFWSITRYLVVRIS